jgi:hypothetical protein
VCLKRRQGRDSSPANGSGGSRQQPSYPAGPGAPPRKRAFIQGDRASSPHQPTDDDRFPFERRQNGLDGVWAYAEQICQLTGIGSFEQTDGHEHRRPVRSTKELRTLFEHKATLPSFLVILPAALVILPIILAIMPSILVTRLPSTVQQTFTALHRRLEEAYRLLVVALGPPVTPEVAVVEAERCARRSPPRRRS